jgi:hypothetical protein
MKKLLVFTVFIAFISISATNSVPPPDKHEFTNLKVFPKDIDEKKLDMIMDVFKASLGVKCSFCHAVSPDSSQGRHLDFASDAKPEKETAREMMKMTGYLNATFFNPDHSNQPDTIHEVMCYTCHRGMAKPDKEALFPQLDSIMKAQRH